MINNEMSINLLKDELKSRGKINLTINGSSMIPCLNSGETVFLFESKTYKIGDIIAFYIKTNDSLKIIVHRVIFIRKDYILTKGDNNNFIDPIRVNKSQILGKVEKNENNTG